MVKFWFVGSGFFAAECLSTISSKIDPEIVVTAPPRKAGRGMKLKYTPVDTLARSRGYTVHCTPSMSEDPFLLEILRNSPPVTILVIDFGQKIVEPFLNFSELGCLNIHPSLLPEYRGAAPVQRAIMEGKTTTGVTVFRLSETMDSGPILAQTPYPVDENTTTGKLLSDLAKQGSMLLLDIISSYIPNNTSFLPQDHSLATFAPKISKEEARLDVMGNAETLHNKVRALNPNPGAFLVYNGKRLKVWETEKVDLQGKAGEVIGFVDGRPVLSTSEGSMVLRTVQPEGKPRMDSSSWARGVRLTEGDMIS